MSTAPNDWDAVARAKLDRVLGTTLAGQVYADTLIGLAMSRIESAADLRRFADRLAAQGGFAGAVGGLLSVHVALHGQH